MYVRMDVWMNYYMQKKKKTFNKSSTIELDRKNNLELIKINHAYPVFNTFGGNMMIGLTLI